MDVEVRAVWDEGILELRIREAALAAQALPDGPVAAAAWIEVERLKGMRAPATIARLDAERLERARR